MKISLIGLDISPELCKILQLTVPMRCVGASEMLYFCLITFFPFHHAKTRRPQGTWNDLIEGVSVIVFQRDNKLGTSKYPNFY